MRRCTPLGKNASSFDACFNPLQLPAIALHTSTHVYTWHGDAAAAMAAGVCHWITKALEQSQEHKRLEIGRTKKNREMGDCHVDADAQHASGDGSIGQPQPMNTDVAPMSLSPVETWHCLGCEYKRGRQVWRCEPEHMSVKPLIHMTEHGVQLAANAIPLHRQRGCPGRSNAPYDGKSVELVMRATTSLPPALWPRALRMKRWPMSPPVWW